jgi:hypothetical protein
MAQAELTNPAYQTKCSPVLALFVGILNSINQHIHEANKEYSTLRQDNILNLTKSILEITYMQTNLFSINIKNLKSQQHQTRLNICVIK